MSAFGDRLRELRKQQGLSQRMLAEKVGIDFTYLSKIENAKMAPPAQKTIRKLADALDASEDELLVLAGKVPDDIKDVVTESKEHPAFFRQVRGLSPNQLEELRKRIQEMKDEEEGSESDTD